MRRLLVAGSLAASIAACGSDDGTPTLTWWINPDPNPPDDQEGPYGQPAIAERCSTDEYEITTEELPGDATEQRIQLARRLASNDTSIDLMSLDPVFTAEFADAEFLTEIPAEQQQQLSDDVLQGAIDGATWQDELVVAPLWANTQVLWYRQSVADAAGLDMSQPVTWDQIIDAAAEQGGTVGVQADRYEGYVVWINALIKGAGGDIVSNTQEGTEAEITIDSEAGTEAARIVNKLAQSRAAQSNLSVSNEGTVQGPFLSDRGAFQLNWTFLYGTLSDEDLEDVGWTRYPQTVEGEQSQPPIGGINIGVNSHSNHSDEALDALNCITSEAEQIQYAVDTGNMPAREAAYDAQELTDQFPADLLDLYRQSIDEAGPRPPTPYWSLIVNATLGRWHPADSVNPDSTPESSATYIRDVLNGDVLV